jgi:hypothetical protein
MDALDVAPGRPGDEARVQGIVRVQIGGQFPSGRQMREERGGSGRGEAFPSEYT